ncbi:MAG: Tim44-like domain-containing protein [Mariprofundaceae bacterium]|nr:Tim44-like domain-containing protein [Mariprofundaceae bacterium]
MRKVFILSFLALFVGVTGFAEHSEAKRFGGGGSFGKSFSKQKSFGKPSPQKNFNSQKAAPTQAGKSGGMMGMLGGLAMGGLLGAMFFGGAFEGINFMDILLFAGIGFAIFWFMRRAASGATRQPEYAHAGQGSPLGGQQDEETAHNNDAFTTSSSSSAMAKPDIDHDVFLNSARDIFMRMQADWDAKNMDDIRSFCTADVAQKVAADIAGLAEHSSKTDVGMLNAVIEDTWCESELDWVAVHFTALLDEATLDAAGQVIEQASNQVDERWIFQHNPHSEDPTWYLAGIQQS